MAPWRRRYARCPLGPSKVPGTSLSAFETRLLSALRSRWAGLAGAAFSVIAFGLLVYRLASGESRAPSLADAGIAPLFSGVAAFLVFQSMAATMLRLLGVGPAARLWASSQVVKYLPVPGSAMFGMAGGALRRGYGTRAALGLVARHTGALAGSAVAIGAPAAAAAAAQRFGIPTALTVMVAVVVGLGGAMLAVADRPVHIRLAVVALACAAWASLGVGLWATAGHMAGESLTVTASFPAAWVVGLAVLPVPAGLGVREFVLILLLESQLGTDGALAYAVVTRAMHVASDGLFALGVATITRLGAA